MILKLKEPLAWDEETPKNYGAEILRTVKLITEIALLCLPPKITSSHTLGSERKVPTREHRYANSSCAASTYLSPIKIALFFGIPP